MRKLSMRILILACTYVGCLGLTSCEDTRFVGVKTQVDTFTQIGDTSVDLFVQDGLLQKDRFDQSGFHQVDEFEQKAAAKIDILWVVDNSRTMLQEQDALAENFDSFITFIDESFIDYQIGVVSTDMDDPEHSGKLRGSRTEELDHRVITRETKLNVDDLEPDPKAVFAQNIKVGETIVGTEQGMYAAYEALAMPSQALVDHNAGFLREDASLAVIFVSDENDSSRGTVGYYARFFQSIKGIGNERNVILAAIVGDKKSDENPEGGCLVMEGEEVISSAQEGVRYHDLVEQVGGTYDSICTQDFVPTLTNLGLTVAGLSRKFVLSKIPDPESVIVQMDIGEGFKEVLADPENGYRLDPAEPAIHFDGDFVPPPQALLEVDYSKVESTFLLSRRGDQGTLQVFVGVENFAECTEDDQCGDAEQFSCDTTDPEATICRCLVDEVCGEDESCRDGTCMAERSYETEWLYDSFRNSIEFGGTTGYVPPLGTVIEIAYSELTRTFKLTRAVEVLDNLDVWVDIHDGNGYRLVYQDGASGWLYHAGEKAIMFNGSFVPPLDSEIKVTYADLDHLFSLSLMPRVETLVVKLDPDGEGPLPVNVIPEDPEDNDATSTAGWVYYGISDKNPCNNCISFEKIEWPPVGSVITVGYQF